MELLKYDTLLILHRQIATKLICTYKKADAKTFYINYNIYCKMITMYKLYLDVFNTVGFFIPDLQ